MKGCLGDVPSAGRILNDPFWINVLSVDHFCLKGDGSRKRQVSQLWLPLIVCCCFYVDVLCVVVYITGWAPTSHSLDAPSIAGRVQCIIRRTTMTLWHCLFAPLFMFCSHCVLLCFSFQDQTPLQRCFHVCLVWQVLLSFLWLPGTSAHRLVRVCIHRYKMLLLGTRPQCWDSPIGSSHVVCFLVFIASL